MRKISIDGINLLEYFEEFRAEVYLDADENPTIVYGHLVSNGMKYPHHGLEKRL